jgi:beta-1,4-mannosyl-glycoprotein beta-1,4-N-acetylglucosaminyltransferase
MTYDLTQLFNELDLLEIRLNILDPYVDKFVIGESRQTFSGKQKPLYYKDNIERFKKWHDKIIHILLPEVETKDVFERTAIQKDTLRLALNECKPEDKIYYGDVDEIWTPQEKEGKLRQLAYSYYLNQRSSEDWQGTNMVLYKNIRNLNDLRADHSVVLENGGWHFTNLGGEEQILKKLDAYDHQEANIQWVRDNIGYRIEQGQDFLGRANDWKGNPFKMWIDESELPEYLLNNKEKWKHLWK